MELEIVDSEPGKDFLLFIIIEKRNFWSLTRKQLALML